MAGFSLIENHAAKKDGFLANSKFDKGSFSLALLCRTDLLQLLHTSSLALGKGSIVSITTVRTMTDRLWDHLPPQIAMWPDTTDISRHRTTRSLMATRNRIWRQSLPTAVESIHSPDALSLSTVPRI